jgi:hypothetical protein
MSSLHRALDDVRIHHLHQDQRLIDPALLARHGRSARTLVKEGPLRLTIVAIGPGGTLPPTVPVGRSRSTSLKVK